MAWEVTALKALSLWRKFAVSVESDTDSKMSESDTDSQSYPGSDSSKCEWFFVCLLFLLSHATVTSQLCSPSDLDLVVTGDEVSYSIESMTGWILAGHTRSSRCLVSIIGKAEETPILIIDCSGHFQQVVE